ncbi:MAG: septum formation protein Maf [Nitrospirae bacterium]|nr:MAG: septum formation protein Maf [Nitrospirota bacterium]
MALVLASTSPRRKDLLALLRIPFEIAAPHFIEHLRGDLAPEEQARQFADGKAQSCAMRFPDRLILGSDTLIALNGEVLGKPADLVDARSMLQKLSGRRHLIHTAVALRRQADAVQDVAVETVLVWMKAFDEAELEAYLHTGESLGKAGAYSIQGIGGRFIERIEGDYTAAVGLPLRLTADLLRGRGLAVPVDVDELYRSKPYPNWRRFER